MPHLSGVFDEFPDLDKVSSAQLMSWLTQKFEVHQVINFLGNRILYPQAIPLTQKELELDLAILRSAIKLKPSLVFQPQTNKIIIPKVFAERFPPASIMVKAIIEGVNPKGVHFIYIKDKQSGDLKSQMKMVGSVISPLNPQKLSTDEKTVVFISGSIRKALPLNAITVVPLSVADTKIMLGTEEYKAISGDVGVIVDLRLGGFG